MDEHETLVAHVSDTARWAAACRALESARQDPVFTDPLADRLAGERGYAIVAGGPRFGRTGWWHSVRAKLFDELIMMALRSGCDMVLNLGAGFDTRPYRLDLPADLVWVEADLPELLAEKELLLGGETARCLLTRRPVDLADPDARSAFLDAELADASKALVLTEGFVYFLSDTAVRALALDLKRPEIAWWGVDFWNAAMHRIMAASTNDLLRSAPIVFAPRAGIAHFEALGWTALEVHSIFESAHRLRRLPPALRPIAYLPQPNPRKPSTRPLSVVARLACTDTNRR